MPRADHDQDAGETDHKPADNLEVGALLSEDGERGDQRGEGREGVDDPGEYGGDVGLSVGEQGERDAVEEHGKHEQVPPRGGLAGHSGAGDGSDDE